MKHLSNFWRTLDTPLINCELSLTLAWSKTCVITDETTRDADPNVDLPVLEIRTPIGSTFYHNRHKIVCTSCYFINTR